VRLDLVETAPPTHSKKFSRQVVCKRNTTKSQLENVDQHLAADRRRLRQRAALEEKLRRFDGRPTSTAGTWSGLQTSQGTIDRGTRFDSVLSAAIGCRTTMSTGTWKAPWKSAWARTCRP
jgi:hypothetical protein